MLTRPLGTLGGKKKVVAASETKKPKHHHCSFALRWSSVTTNVYVCC